VPILDWFHIAMRLTGLGQYTKGLAHHNPVEATALENRLDRRWCTNLTRIMHRG